MFVRVGGLCGHQSEESFSREQPSAEAASLPLTRDVSLNLRKSSAPPRASVWFSAGPGQDGWLASHVRVQGLLPRHLTQPQANQDWSGPGGLLGATSVCSCPPPTGLQGPASHFF